MDVDGGAQRVFVCSMADLFGAWVPRDWIEAVLEQVRACPQWTFLFLTKNPKRLAEFTWPDNAWVGATVDTQARVARTEDAFRNVTARIKWISCEPLTDDLRFRSLDLFNWVVIGAKSQTTRCVAGQPHWEWVENLIRQARAAGCRCYIKPNLTVRPKEFPL